MLFVTVVCCASSFILHLVQDDSIFSGKTAWNAAEEESLLDAMDMYSFGNWCVSFPAPFLISCCYCVGI